jgi:hypothetical protein
MHRPLLMALAVLLAGCGGGGGASNAEPAGTPPGSAFFYQDVNAGANTVRAGFTTDNRLIDAYRRDVASWVVLGGATRVYGDPVISRLANGRWAMAAGTGHDDPRGASALMYHEAACPQVTDSAVKVLNRSSAVGCEANGMVAMAKPSQVFAAFGSNYIFLMADGRILLTRLTDATHVATDLASICVRRVPASSATALGWGEATVVIDSVQAPGLFLSDTAIARRADGTWVLFVKGILASVGCSGGNLCELCARSIYRTTSTDLMTWTPLVKMVDRASVPDAGVAPDGSVWLYWQDFGPACDAQDLQLAARSPIRGAAEIPGGTLATSAPIRIPAEPFETDTRLHYPTNGNPVLLPDAAAKTAFDACFGR